MLNGKELGDAIQKAIELKTKSGSIQSKADVAKHFGIKTPSIYDWIKKGSISKDKLPELWSYFSDVVGPEHWGLASWPMSSSENRYLLTKNDVRNDNLHNVPVVAEDPIGAISALLKIATPRGAKVLTELSEIAQAGKLQDSDIQIIEAICSRYRNRT